MKALGVVEGFDIVKDLQLGLVGAGKGAALDLQLGFEFTPEALHVGVFVAMLATGEAGPYF